MPRFFSRFLTLLIGSLVPRILAMSCQFCYIPVSIGSKRYINHPKDRHLLYNYISVGFHDFILIVIHFPCFGGLGI
jgi:hypothetical protein